MGWGLLIAVFLLIVSIPGMLLLWFIKTKVKTARFEDVKMQYENALKGKDRKKAEMIGVVYYKMLDGEKVLSKRSEIELQDDLNSHPQLK